MARVLLVTPSLPPSPEPESLLGWRIANTLAESQHDVKVLTGQHGFEAFPEYHQRVEVLQIFRRWSLLELPRLFPLWLQWRPEVLHLLPPPRPKSLWYSLPMIPGAFPMLQRPRIVASFWRLPERGWMFQSATLDAVTVANQNQKHRLTSQPGAQPLVETMRLFDGRRPFSKTQDILPKGFNNYLFVPGPCGDHEAPQLPLTLISKVLPHCPNWQVVFGGSLEELGYKTSREWMSRLRSENLDQRIFFTGPLEVTQISDLIENSAAVFAASLKMDSFQTSLALQAGHTFAKPMVLNTLQATYDPYNWINGESAQVCTRQAKEMAEKLLDLMSNEILCKKLGRRLQGDATTVSDHAANILSRLYLTPGPTTV